MIPIKRPPRVSLTEAEMQDLKTRARRKVEELRKEHPEFFLETKCQIACPSRDAELCAAAAQVDDEEQRRELENLRARGFRISCACACHS